jgi:hypothetical protein
MELRWQGQQNRLLILGLVTFDPKLESSLFKLYMGPRNGQLALPTRQAHHPPQEAEISVYRRVLCPLVLTLLNKFVSVRSDRPNWAGRCDNLDAQGRLHEIFDRDERMAAVAHEYVGQPERTLVVSRDNQSRIEINQTIHYAIQDAGKMPYLEHKMTVLVPRQEITGADRRWAAQYEPGDVVRYTKGSKTHGIEAGEYARVQHTNEKENLVTVKRENGQQVSYDPRRLHGVTLYRETERAFSQGNRVQFTAPNREQHIANRELGTIEKIDDSGKLQLRLDSGRAVAFNIKENLHLTTATQ